MPSCTLSITKAQSGKGVRKCTQNNQPLSAEPISLCQILHMSFHALFVTDVRVCSHQSD